MKTIVFLTAAFALSCILTGLLRRYALRVRMLDLPNERSSHAVPTPRGGGTAIVLVFFLGLAVLFQQGHVPLRLLLVLLPACSLTALIGWLDDHSSVPAAARFCVHLAAAGAGLFFLGGLPWLPLPGENIHLGPWSYLFLLPGLVWAVNLHNFMDGIDGIASVEALCVFGGGAVILVLSGGDGPHILVLVLLAAATAGFLVWNWPPARIFMGDAGSGFLGMAIGLTALAASAAGPVNLWSWLILYGVFVVDATVTLVTRVLRGKRFWEPHRSHAYQILARRWGSHRRVTVSVLAVNICWLFPLAIVSSRYPQLGMICAALALAPLAVGAVGIGAGTAER